MKSRLIRGKAKGQSIPIIALMIVVLVALVGLSVDVGNTYAEQRNTQRSTNSAAIAGLSNLVAGGDDTSVTSAIMTSLKANNIDVAAMGSTPQEGQRTVTANYMDASGNPLTACPNVGSNCPTSALAGVKYIHVSVTGNVTTYFARVVGRNDLPVGADAWATRSTCSAGIYPIGVRSSYLGSSGFADPDTTYSDDTYRNKTVKTLYIHDPTNNPSGGFTWLRWKSSQNSGNATELAAMLTGPGNISDGFGEAAWPTGQTTIAKPSGYPLSPNELTAGDWVLSNTGVSNASSVRAQLDYHIANKTVLNLPIWDASAGSGNTGSYHMSEIGSFLLLGYQLNGTGYFKLAYLGKGGECITTSTPPTRSNNLGIIGQVKFRPRYRDIPDSRPPVQYEIVLDVSGSMSWTYEGYGWYNGKQYQCTGTTASCSGAAYAWKDQTLRRIYFAKNAIKSFIDQMQTNDTMRIVTFSGGPISSSNTKAITSFTKAWPTTGWSSDKTALKSAVDSAGAVGDPYKTEGRTPSAVGLAAGTQQFQSAPTTSSVTGETYKRVAIFLTDGVANIRRDGTSPTYTGSCGSEIASCNVGYSNGVALPITAMLAEADTLKQYATIYTIALAGVDETGLKDVASASNYPFFSSSTNGGDLEGIFDNIATDVQYGDCVPDGGNTWETTMDEDQVGTVAAPQGPLSYPTVGYAYLYDANGGALADGKGKAAISVDAQSGQLIYQFSDLTPGTYQIRAFVGYKGEDDISRIYDQIYNINTATADTTYTFTIDPSRAIGTVVPVDTLYLDMSGSVCSS